eukprot:NODE_757_length_4169_cov_0.564619.p3 type:complete len:229 gc:universal NODE_757_length_4169_cov_0.564619:2671-1985(-)
MSFLSSASLKDSTSYAASDTFICATNTALELHCDYLAETGTGMTRIAKKGKSFAVYKTRICYTDTKNRVRCNDIEKLSADLRWNPVSNLYLQQIDLSEDGIAGIDLNKQFVTRDANNHLSSPTKKTINSSSVAPNGRFCVISTDGCIQCQLQPESTILTLTSGYRYTQVQVTNNNIFGLREDGKIYKRSETGSFELFLPNKFKQFHIVERPQNGEITLTPYGVPDDSK